MVLSVPFHSVTPLPAENASLAVKALSVGNHRTRQVVLREG